MSLRRTSSVTALVAALAVAAAACGGDPSPDPNTPVAMPPLHVKGPPPAADPAPVVDGDITVASANGIRILVKRIPGAELTAAQLYIRGGVANWSERDGGIEMLALRVATTGGTQQLDKDAFSRKLTKLGSDLGASTSYDYSVIEQRSLTTKFDETFELLVQAFLTPAMLDKEVELNRQRQLLGIKRDQETPDGRIALVLNDAVWTGHPYHARPIGTVESVTPLTTAALGAHLAKLRETSRLELIVVGDVAAEHVIERVKAAFGKLPLGTFVKKPLPVPAFDKPTLLVKQADVPTTYVIGSFIGPGWQSPEMPTAFVATRILHDRVWEEVRTKRNLSYAPSAGFRSGVEVTRGQLYVTAVDPNTTWKVMLDEVKRLAETDVPAADLAGAKAQFLTGHLAGNESTSGQASWLGTCDVVGGDYKLAKILPEQIAAVKAADVKAFAKNRVLRLQTAVLGDASKLDRALFESR
jgi:zinc protease